MIVISVGGSVKRWIPNIRGVGYMQHQQRKQLLFSPRRQSRTTITGATDGQNQ